MIKRPEELFELILTKHFENRFKTKERREGFHCSSADSCAMQIARTVLKEKPSNTPSLQQEIRWLVGHHLESLFDSIFKDIGILVSTNEKIDGEVRCEGGSEKLSGELDEIIEINLSVIEKLGIDINSLSPKLASAIKKGLKAVVDMKTAGANAWNFIPKEANIVQLNLYLHFKKIRHGFLVYLNPDTGKYKIFYVPYSKEMYQAVINKYEYILKHVCKNSLPPRGSDDYRKFPCSWIAKKPGGAIGCCEYFDVCWGLKFDDIVKKATGEQSGK